MIGIQAIIILIGKKIFFCWFSVF